MFVRTLQHTARKQHNGLVKYSFPVPNDMYIDWTELDDENAKDGMKSFTVRISDEVSVAAISNDILISTVGYADGMSVADRMVTPNWGITPGALAVAFRAVAKGVPSKSGAKAAGKMMDQPSYFRYNVFASKDTKQVRKEIHLLRKINAPRKYVVVTEVK